MWKGQAMQTLRRLNDLFIFRSRITPLVIGFVLLGIVGSLDWLTGPKLDFALFYLIPVCFVTWHTGKRFGYVASVVSAAVWLCVDRLTGAESSDPLLVQWNLAMRLTFFSGSVLLLSGRRNVERSLSKMVEQRTSALRNLAAQLSAAEDAERRKLAYDMHDALSQALSLIKMNLDSAQLVADDPAARERRLASCGTMIDEVIKQTRTLMFDLHPAMLDDLGLVPTFQWYAADFEQRTRTELVVSEHGTRRPLPVATANYLFLAVKELLGNAVRHGYAAEIIVAVHWEQSSVRVVVDDDGRGFDVGAVRAPDARRGLGLAGLDERVSSMGGSLVVESKPGQGTRVIIEVPAPVNNEETSHAIASAAR
jgi:signal transduction histidine kinase